MHSFSLTQSGASNQARGFNFTTTAGSSAVVSSYYAWLITSTGNSLSTLPNNAFLLGSVQNLGPGVQTIPTWYNSPNWYDITSGTTYYIYITANVLNTAPAGSTITVSPPTTANFTWTSGETNGGNTSTASTVTVATGGPCTGSTFYSYNGGPLTTSGSVQQYVVPPGVTSIGVDVAGAVGGTGAYQNSKSYGGMGGVTSSTLTVTPGSTLFLYVGNVGGSCIYSGNANSGYGGSNSGGGGQGGNASWFEGGGGGGSSDIRTTSGTLTSRVVIGGGGGGGSSPFVTTMNQNTGGIGGNPSGGLGIFNGFYNATECGSPGTLVCCAAAGSGGTAGALGAGGNCPNFQDGGGGGGGYYGAGGAKDGGACGGSSFAQSGGGVTVVATTYANGTNTGPGYIVIRQLCSNPPANTATATVLCPGGTATFSNSTGSGTWSSSNPSIISVNSGTGVATAGTTTGTATISYVVSGGCFANTVVTVNSLPSIGSISTNSPLCVASNLTLTANAPANVTGYSWSGPATITSGATTASAVAAAVPATGDGVYSVTVNNGTGVGCAVTYTTSVSFIASPGTIGASSPVCQGATVTFTNSVAGGTWSSSNSNATVSPTGDVTGITLGTGAISYTISSGCSAVRNITVNPSPALALSPSGSSTICINQSATYTAFAPGSTFSWSGISGAGGLSCSACATTTITPTTDGANIYSVTATNAFGCATTGGALINVNPLPAVNGGPATTCIGTNVMLTNATPGGTWISGTPSVAFVNSATGELSPLSVGGATISYTSFQGCVRTSIFVVTPAPPAIIGAVNVCTGSTATLSHSISGGTWASSDAAVANVGVTGVVTGVAQGLATITYTIPSGCIATSAATVNAMPTVIGGSSSVCINESITLSNTVAGGTWSSPSGNVSVNATSGEVTGVTAGTASVTYMMPSGCFRAKTITVNPLPAPISGTLSACQNAISTLSNATSGGVWTSSNGGVANVDASGMVIGISQGVSTISYTLSTGCRTTANFVVNPLPATIGGTKVVCQAATTTLDNIDGGGVWTSSNSSIAAIDAAGIVTGGNAGTAVITYTLPTTCRRTTVVTVNALPGAINGTLAICQAAATTLSSTPSGGTWTSDATLVAAIDASGAVTAGIAGQANITYSLSTGCARSAVVTVNALPGTITGNLAVCIGQVTTLSNLSAGGSWSSSTPAVATVNASGTVAGVTAGTTTITYTLPTGCLGTTTLTVNALPANITGNAVVCFGATTTLSSASAGGTWASEFDVIATVSGTGVVTGAGDGNTFITYTLPTGCYRTRLVTVNPLPDAITGATQVCVASSTTLSSTTTGGTWLSGTPGNASVSAAGLVTGLSSGSSQITYTAPTGCRISTNVVINPLPGNITGATSVCVNSTITLSSVPGGGTWAAGNTGVVSIDPSGVVTGIAAGTSSITYTLPTGCRKTTNVAVNPLPLPISGALNVCQGATTALTNASTGGAWTSSNSSIAGVSASGVVSGSSVGSAVITYTLPTNCRAVASVVVNTLPGAITGTMQVCAGSTVSLSNATINGSWTSNPSFIASIDASGTVTGNIAGSASITYQLPTGCSRVAGFVVNMLPVNIAGATSICEGLATTLTNITGGGSWTSSNTAIAPVSVGGMVTGLAAGGAAITYTLPTGCYTTKNIAIDPIPDPITGPDVVCVAGSVMVNTTTTGGFWGSASPEITVSYLGQVTGVSAGTATVTYMLPSGCIRTRSILVNPLPAVISGSNNVCTGAQLTLGNSMTGGTWSTNSAALATVNASTGVVTGVANGNVLVSYTLPTGCVRTKSVDVNETPAAISGIAQICNGGATTLSNTSTGGIWVSSNTPVALASLSTGDVTGVAAGTATISYVMPSGCLTKTTVTVNPNPASVTGILSICQGNATVLSNATLGGSWSVSDPATASVSGAGVLSGLAAGSATVTYTLPTGCYNTAAAAINPLPAVFNVTGGGSACAGAAGLDLHLDGSALSTTYNLYNGTTLAGTYSGTGAPVYFGAFTAAGSYMVSATTASGCSRDMSGAATINIIPVVAPSVAISSASGATVCSGSAVNYSATAVNGGTTPSYVWKVNGTTMSGSGSTYTYTPNTGDVISVELTSNAACAIPATVSDATVMTVLSNETPAVTITVGPSESICKGTTATFTAVPMHGGDAPVYTWLKNGSTPMGGGSVLSYVPADNDVITCWLNSNYECLLVDNVTSNEIAMNVDEIFVPVVQVVVTPGTTISDGEQATFTAMVTNGGPTPAYAWLKNGVLISGANAATYVTANIADGDEISCVVKGSGLCGQTSDNAVVMSVLPSTGISTVAVSDIRLTPNPNNGSFVITGSVANSSNQIVALEITDMLGQVVYTSAANVSNGQINERIQIVNTLANGMYILNVTTGTDRKSFHFVVKQ